MAERLHAIVQEPARRASAPKTWYGMPAYARDGKVVCYFQERGEVRLEVRDPRLRATQANLDEGRHVADLLRAGRV